MNRLRNHGTTLGQGNFATILFYHPAFIYPGVVGRKKPCEELDRGLDLICVQILLNKMRVSVPEADRPLELCSVELEATIGQEQMEVETALEPEKAPSPPPPPPVPPGEFHILG